MSLAAQSLDVLISAAAQTILPTAGAALKTIARIISATAISSANPRPAISVPCS
jgi:hypothetical protein